MKKTLVIPVLNDEARLPALFPALKALRKKDALELLFVDGASRDGSLAALKDFAKGQKDVRILREEEPGYAAAYNRGLKDAKGELLFFLDAETIPAADWSLALSAALAEADVAVPRVETEARRGVSPYGQVAALLFKGRSERTARATGFALPWGAVAGLGVRREWFARLGGFAPAAGAAFDQDWCWRAVLAGAHLVYAPDATATKARPDDKESVLHHFEAYGLAETWIHRAYSFLGEDGGGDPVVSANEAYLRLAQRSPAAAKKSLAAPLGEVACAFASGIRLGHELPAPACALHRSAPKTAISWWSGKKELTVFVPGKGVTTLSPQPAQLFLAWKKGADQEELEALFRKLFKASTAEAQHGVEELLEAFAPGSEDAISWVPLAD